MKKWLDPDWYRYVWQRKLSFETQAFLVVLAVAIVLLGGFVVADQLASASGTSSDAYILRSTTVTKIVATTKNGKTVVRRYPVVHSVRIKARRITVQSLRSVTTPGTTVVVPVTTVKYVPVDRVVTNVVTRDGKTRTLVQTRPVTVQRTVATTVSQTQTQLQTVVTTQPVTTTSTVVQTTTRATTVTSTTTRTVTQTRTVTVPLATVTIPITITVKTTT